MNRATFFLILLTPIFPAFAQGVHAIPTSVPTLDDIGLIGLAIAVGLAAGWAVKRKK